MKDDISIFGWLFVVLSICSGCKSTITNNALAADEYRLDNAFNYTPSVVESEQSVFALSPEMEHYVAENLIDIADPFNRAQRLLSDLFTPERLALAYDNGADLVAEEAFKTQLANCLSLTIMTHALAKQANISTQFRHVQVEENWSQRHQEFVTNGHVNLRVIGDRFNTNDIYSNQSVVIDFVPNLAKYRSKPLTKRQIVAMFYGNKGADAMLQGNFDIAYTYLVEGLEKNSKDPSLWHNLGILYKRSGHLGKAEQLYNYSLSLKPNNNAMLESLAVLYQVTERKNEASALRQRLNISRKKNPYYHAMLGDQAYQNSQYKQAIVHYKKSLSLNRKQAVILFSLAKSYFAINQFDRSHIYLKRAMKFSPQSMERQRYQQKLEALKPYTTKVNQDTCHLHQC